MILVWTTLGVSSWPSIGETFQVFADLSQPDALRLEWVSGPNEGYGFTTRNSLLVKQGTGVSIKKILTTLHPSTRGHHPRCRLHQPRPL